MTEWDQRGGPMTREAFDEVVRRMKAGPIRPFRHLLTLDRVLLAEMEAKGSAHDWAKHYDFVGGPDQWARFKELLEQEDKKGD